MNERSFGGRYLSKVVSGGAGLVASMASQVLVARALGPAFYGGYSFLTNFFNQWVEFFDAGASICFYNRLSQSRDEKWVRFNWEILGGIGLVVGAVVLIVLLAGGQKVFWPDQKISWIWLALALVFVLKVSQTAGLVVDAHGLTVDGEKTRTAQRALSLAVLGFMYWAGTLHLIGFFYQSILMALVLLWFWFEVLRRRGHRLFPLSPLSRDVRRTFALDVWAYSNPLVLHGFIGMAAGVLDRWFLQRYAGSVDQGFFGLSYQFSSVCFLFSGAMTPLIMREFSLAHHRNDPAEIRIRFQRYVPLLFSITGFLSVFVAVKSGALVQLVGGGRFKDAAGPLAVMAFFPLHQTLSQFCGSYFYATDQTRLYRNIGVAGSLMGLIGSYFFLAPPSRGGMGAGSMGLAVKMVLFQFLTTNVLLWSATRSLNLRFGLFVRQQIVITASWVGLAGASAWVASRALHPPVGQILLTGFIYLLGGLALLKGRPDLLGATPGDVLALERWVRGGRV